MPIYLYGLGLRNYRGVGPELQIAAPLESCNFFIGTNNSGKSCFLNFIAGHLTHAQGYARNVTARLPIKPLEIHLGATEHQLDFCFAIPLALARTRALELIHARNPAPDQSIIRVLDSLLRYLAHCDLIWTSVKFSSLAQFDFLNIDGKPYEAALLDMEWRTLWASITGMSGGDPKDWIEAVRRILLEKFTLAYPPAHIIPAKRQIGMKGEKFGDFSGAGLIDKLAELQNPGPTTRNLRTIFDKVNAFLQEVTGDPTATIEIPHDREEVLVHKGPRVLPLSSLGTGIHEVVMIAAFCTLTENSIVCIEEPEIHLHPLLQKKLIKYITSKTSNQYFIATHSASVIDQPKAAVFHVTQKNDAIAVELAASSSHRFRVCQDLGYRASDLLQTNAIIWVEGPSDRIYLNHWIASVDRNLKEGIHYSIMYYGGRLLSHLSASDDEVTEFILLRKLNQNMAIVIDSDKRSQSSAINETKKRVIDEFRSLSDLAWLTAGREIENYIPESILDAALKSVYKNFVETASSDRYAHRLHFFSSGKSSKLITDVDKIKIARAVCDFPADLSMFDLKSKINNVVSMIQKANQ